MELPKFVARIDFRANHHRVSPAPPPHKSHRNRPIFSLPHHGSAHRERKRKVKKIQDYYYYYYISFGVCSLVALFCFD